MKPGRPFAAGGGAVVEVIHWALRDSQVKMFVLMFSFFCLAAFKFFGAVSENANAAAALVYAVMFGSPQLIWLWFCGKPSLNDGQIRTAAYVAMAFVVTSLCFGSFPGLGSPAWGGEGHFEVPLAFLAEWLVSIVGIAVFLARGKRRHSGDA
ncbi:hypothetical protein PY254_16310 [Rhodanobacter sp. AS-Z3]|uniref:hypothetical protein n=1 Tax=Rhodanobacter sp. AS-Z3 TaxID=3031330 RepID=UPI00247A7FAC|nr:hypothetical protein [Rhodanobacter sp. AS-Z3]WEN14776.1 hypothetical protein PY254_16310 [Rhodanobacter sp. AS-Z3]